MTEPTIITLGCRLNTAEAETVRAHVRAAGLDDCIVVNTCAVTAESVRQAAQTIRRSRRENPGARLIVTGCAAQIEPERFAAMGEVDAVIGNAEKLKRETYEEIAQSAEAVVRVGDIGVERRLVVGQSDAPLEGGARTRAIVAVQNGCDHRCTFCIIPVARGASRSMPVADAVRRIERLVADGHGEVVLTGVDLTSYGGDLEERATLGTLVQDILGAVPGLKRLRLSSIDQVEVDDALFDVIASEPRLMPHLHLSLQSGDDLVLKRMKRRHTRTDAITFCERVRSLRPDAVFGADLIAGFPTETDAMFEATLQTIEACGLTYLHVFPFSARPGTPAARMPQVAPAAVAARAARLRDEGRRRAEAFFSAQVGTVQDVLMERGGTGRTPQFAEVAVTPPPAAGIMQSVRISGYDGVRLHGEPMPDDRNSARSRSSAKEFGVNA